ncbi:MAG: hypothetical protein KGI68_11145 [Alphaproteobacteria bacterium]|nr:hypothetical protein [Alphaproteobacteria bacterium]MDE1986080.1 hypothetical protein [Alphaproteobacteria bacterium]MDE2264410.1 hypothetical protein [Alphaproteobacteria bacterium]MDE2499354.1 hypothetical protein [Alphaproteobacteria bacterium]
MFVFMRLVSLVLVVIALMLLGADAVSSLEHHGEITVRSLGAVWALFDKGSVDAFMVWSANTLPGFLAQGIKSALVLPGWGVTGVLGVILAFIFGRKHDAG